MIWLVVEIVLPETMRAMSKPDWMDKDTIRRFCRLSDCRAFGLDMKALGIHKNLHAQ